MKWLYRILRLLKCPHKYSEEKPNKLKCKYCGKIKNVRCNHEYKIIDRTGILRNEKNFGDMYILQCSKCGILKRERYYVAG